MDVNSSISLLSHIHSITADFLTRKLSERGFPEFASSHGNILFQLSVNEKMTMGELAERINRDKSTTTVLVRKLEAEGFLTGSPDPSDKRIIHDVSNTFYLGVVGRCLPPLVMQGEGTRVA